MPSSVVWSAKSDTNPSTKHGGFITLCLTFNQKWIAEGKKVFNWIANPMQTSANSFHSRNVGKINKTIRFTIPSRFLLASKRENVWNVKIHWGWLEFTERTFEQHFVRIECSCVRGKRLHLISREGGKLSRRLRVLVNIFVWCTFISRPGKCFERTPKFIARSESTFKVQCLIGVVVKAFFESSFNQFKVLNTVLSVLQVEEFTTTPDSTRGT